VFLLRWQHLSEKRPGEETEEEDEDFLEVMKHYSQALSRIIMMIRRVM
jgi:hypothetical protein